LSGAWIVPRLGFSLFSTKKSIFVVNKYLKNMKRINYFIITLLIIGYAGSIKSADELVVIDVTKSYPKKELNLKDISG